MTNRLTRIVAMGAGVLTFVGSAGAAHSVWSDTAEVTLSVSVPAAPTTSPPSPTPPPATPTNFYCAAGGPSNSHVDLRWTAAEGAVEYRLNRDGGTERVVATPVTEYKLQKNSFGQFTGDEMTVTLYAWSSSGSSGSTSVTITFGKGNTPGSCSAVGP